MFLPFVVSQYIEVIFSSTRAIKVLVEEKIGRQCVVKWRYWKGSGWNLVFYIAKLYHYVEDFKPLNTWGWVLMGWGIFLGVVFVVVFVWFWLLWWFFQLELPWIEKILVSQKEVMAVLITLFLKWFFCLVFWVVLVGVFCLLGVFWWFLKIINITF